jgi:dihydrofolate reductase
MTRGKLNLIVAGVRGATVGRPGIGIGFRGGLPWTPVKEDMALFRAVTSGKYANREGGIDYTCVPGDCAVLMGATTWESLPVPALPGRQNIVVSRSMRRELVAGELTHENLHCVTDLSERTLNMLRGMYAHTWVIGGQQIYEAVLREHVVDNMVVVSFCPEKQLEFDTYFTPPTLGNPSMKRKHFFRKPLGHPQLKSMFVEFWENLGGEMNAQSA